MLCSRLDCSHASQDCDAYCGEATCIGLFQDHLYFITTLFQNGIYSQGVFQTEKDGSQHRVFMDLGDFSGGAWEEHGFRNGYYFYIMEDVVLPEENPDTTSFEMVRSLYMVDLRKTADPPFLMETWNSKETAITLIQVVENTLYYITGFLDGEKTLWCYNLDTHEKQRILDYNEVYNFFVQDNRIYLLSREQGIMVYDTQSQTKETVFSFGNDADRGFIQSDGQYFYVFQKSIREEESGKEALIIDCDGNIVNRLRLPEPMKICFVTEDYLFLRSAKSYDFPKYAIQKQDIASPDVQLIPVKHP